MSVKYTLEGFGFDDCLVYERDLTDAEVMACKAAYADKDDPEMIYCYQLNLFGIDLVSRLIGDAPGGLSYFITAYEPGAI